MLRGVCVCAEVWMHCHPLSACWYDQLQTWGLRQFWQHARSCEKACLCVCSCPWVMSKYSNRTASLRTCSYIWMTIWLWVRTCVWRGICVRRQSIRWCSMLVLAEIVCVLARCKVCALLLFVYSCWVSCTVQTLILPLRNSHHKHAHYKQQKQMDRPQTKWSLQ